MKKLFLLLTVFYLFVLQAKGQSDNEYLFYCMGTGDCKVRILNPDNNNVEITRFDPGTLNGTAIVYFDDPLNSITYTSTGCYIYEEAITKYYEPGTFDYTSLSIIGPYEIEVYWNPKITSIAASYNYNSGSSTTIVTGTNPQSSKTIDIENTIHLSAACDYDGSRIVWIATNEDGKSTNIGSGKTLDVSCSSLYNIMKDSSFRIGVKITYYYYNNIRVVNTYKTYTSKTEWLNIRPRTLNVNSTGCSDTFSVSIDSPGPVVNICYQAGQYNSSTNKYSYYNIRNNTNLSCTATATFTYADLVASGLITSNSEFSIRAMFASNTTLPYAKEILKMTFLPPLSEASATGNTVCAGD